MRAQCPSERRRAGSEDYHCSQDMGALGYATQVPNRGKIPQYQKGNQCDAGKVFWQAGLQKKLYLIRLLPVQPMILKRPPRSARAMVTQYGMLD